MAGVMGENEGGGERNGSWQDFNDIINPEEKREGRLRSTTSC